MNRRNLVLVALAPVAASVAIFVACTSGQEASPTSPSPPIAPVPTDASIDTSAPEPPVERPTCTPVDLQPGTGGKFCDLPGTDAANLSVPPEFCIREFTTTPVTENRVLRFAPNGDLFVAAPSMTVPGGASGGAGAILVLPDDNGDGKADAVLTFAGGSPANGNGSCAPLESDPNNLACVHGLAFASDGYLYYTRSDEVRRFPYTAGARVAPSPAGEVVAPLGGGGVPDVRWTHTLEQTKTGTLYVSRGRFDTSACTPDELKSGAVFALHIENKPAMPLVPEVVSDGFRNPMFLRCSPASCGDCYASELSGDGWDHGIGGREKLALLNKKGESWGYPCCVQRNVAAPGLTADCSSVGRELVAIPLHDTPFGFDFDRGGFPEPYKHGVFAALHGVVSSFGGSGIIWLKTDPVSLRPTGDATLFVKGFGRTINGRATDAVFAPDGRLFIADDTSGKIYWVAPRTLAKPK